MTSEELGMTPEQMMGIIDLFLSYPEDEDDYVTVWRVLEESQRIQLRDRARHLTGIHLRPPEQWICEYQTNLQNLLKKLNIISADSATLMKVAVLKARAERLRLHALNGTFRVRWNKIEGGVARREHKRGRKVQQADFLTELM